MGMLVCGYCGDRYSENMLPHLCWLVQKINSQEILPSLPVEDPGPLSDPLEDDKVPARVRLVDLSNF